MIVKPEAKGESALVLPTAAFLISLSLALPFVGGLGEAAGLVSALTDGGVLFGVILGAILCGLTGLDLLGESSRRMFLPALLCVFLSGLPIMVIRVGEVRHRVTPAGPVDFWLALEAVISSPVLACSASLSYERDLSVCGITSSRASHSSWYWK